MQRDMAKHRAPLAALCWQVNGLVAVVLLAMLPLGVLAQSSPPDTGQQANTSALPTPSPPAFVLTIQASEDIRNLLETQLELQRYKTLPDLSDNELRRLLVAAEKNATSLIATLGYFSPEIQIDFKAPDSGAPRLVTLKVEPGVPTLVGSVAIAFAGAITSDPDANSQRQQIEAEWALRPNAHFTQSAWTAAKQRALRQLTALRYPTGHIATTLADIDPVTHQANLHIELDSGPAFQLGSLVITGAERYGDAMVSRQVRLAPGTHFDQAQLIAAQQRLSDSGYFESAFLSLDTAGDPASAPIKVEVREVPLQKVVLGIGVSTDAGVRLSTEHTHYRVPGIGWRAVSKLLADRVSRSIATELTAPPDDGNWRWVVGGSLQQKEMGSYSVNSQLLRAGRSQTDFHIDRNYYLQYDRADTAARENTDPVIAEAISANYAFTLRNFDNAISPVSGWGLGVELGGGSTLGSQQEPYGRVVLRWQSYQPLGTHDAADPLAGRTGRLAWRGALGSILAVKGTSIPSTQLFLTGGDTSVRGYSQGEIGVSLPGQLTTSGRTMAAGSLEWQRPIRIGGQPSDWESTVFLDTGAVANQWADIAFKVGIGAGARWKSPVGPVQMDLAYGVATQKFRLHMSVGFSF